MISYKFTGTFIRDYKYFGRYPSLRYIFDNLSLTFLNSNYTIINLFALGRSNKIPGFFEFKYQAKNMYRFNSEPIGSMYLDPINSTKCFTYFNEKQVPITIYKIDIDEIKIQVFFAYQWFPYEQNYGISVALHSPNMIPPRDSFFKIEQNTIQV